MNRTITINTLPEISVFNENEDFQCNVHLDSADNDVYLFSIRVTTNVAASPKPITVRWKVPHVNVKGVWKPITQHDKRLQYDWELVHLQSRISVGAPIVNVFGHDDSNMITFACSDTVNLTEMNAVLREEDNHLYCHLTLFSERHPDILQYNTNLRIDRRSINYGRAVSEVAEWWSSFESMKPCLTPDLAYMPLYSTWYSFHQNLNETKLLEECKIAKTLGYDFVIIDDGWQTLDDQRGYDHTGDWQPERFPDMANFVKGFHDLGVKVGLWFSVPFCGKKSTAYHTFKGKFLTENHRWAPVFDPRYPEIREYLIGIYSHALRTYNLDAFKLDFIDDFRAYPDTDLTLANGRDFANVNEAVDRLMTDVMLSLKAIKHDIAIEFRQKYIGPTMRKFGNMFRAFDCPNDPVSNRIRTVDVKLLCGETAVHSDMLTWHFDEKVELAALQVLSGFFSVPQMSIMLSEAPRKHLEMIGFYTKYWSEHRNVLMNGSFSAVNPLGNYSMLQAQMNEHIIIGLYDNVVCSITNQKKIDVLNGTTNSRAYISGNGTYEMTVRDCRGRCEASSRIQLTGVKEIEIPQAGMASLTRV